MALLGVQFSKCARVGLDSADIVRDNCLQPVTSRLIPSLVEQSSKGGVPLVVNLLNSLSNLLTAGFSHSKLAFYWERTDSGHHKM